MLRKMGAIAPENGRIGPEKLRQFASQDDPPHAARPLRVAGRTTAQSALIRGAREPARLGPAPVLVTLLAKFSGRQGAFSGAIGYIPEQRGVVNPLSERVFRSGRIREATDRMRAAGDAAAESGRRRSVAGTRAGWAAGEGRRDGRRHRAGRGIPAALGHGADAARGYAAASRAASTRLIYDADWNRFQTWCAARGEMPLPADPGVVARFCAGEAEAGRAPSTITRRLAAIGWAHKRGGHKPPLSRDNQDGCRIASSRNAPEAEVHCLIQNAPDESVVVPF